MRFLLLSLTVLATVASYVSAADDEDVKVEVTNPVECSRKTQRGDKIEVHYRGTLAQDESQFDASYDREQPLSFTVGTGQVIKGWDEGLLGMCVGEKRLLTIKPDFGYGNRAMGPIPAGSTLSMVPQTCKDQGALWLTIATIVFETELMGISGVKKDEL